MHIALTTTVWGRMDVTIPVLKHYASLDPQGVTFSRSAVCSSHKEGERVEALDGWTSTYYPNEPLSEKHNKAFERAMRERPDAVCVVNSDDVLTEAYFENAVDCFAERCKVVRMLSSVMVDLPTGRAAYVPDSYPMSGIIMGAYVAHELDFRPWEGEPINKWLDGRLAQNLQRIDPQAAGFKQQMQGKIQLCSLKSREQIWSYDDHIEQCDGPVQNVDATKYLNLHFPELRPLLETHAEIQRKE